RFSSRAPEALCIIRGRHHRVQRRGERLGGLIGDEYARSLILYDVPETAGIEGDDRCLAQLALDGDQPESLLTRWDDEHTGASVEGRQLLLRNGAMPCHAVSNP